MSEQNLLGNFLKDRRSRLDAASLGFSMTRRRTPGLRREEVALRANVSTTWYTWLEQGREGAPSSDVLERLARALALSDVEREYLFLLAQNRPPQLHHQPPATVSAQLQRLLDAMENIPAFVKTADWTVVAWNRAASVVLADYAEMTYEERNILRMVFCCPSKRAVMPEWEKVASFVVATFRAESARAGMTDASRALIEELNAASPEFKALWLDQNVSHHGEGTKRINHARVGLIHLDYSSFAVEGNPNLSLVIYNPSTEIDKKNVHALLRLSTVVGFAV
ncbi:helix-turn-helix transcriptional regulator [Rouxiella badensis]|jgi:transcriptional regulator with XRE-family HTH domain|uniref:Transcriptional regulator n=1 Tax=Rouxiella badensis TaxID=1646377 RepID=A0A1X0WH19_9GAMM|nr:helix-turn-helix transcriptional regulator [Rouxiella badensis]MCC3701881.1 helix-turn-helix transcriptional regulator [Rouxiella badensis]MCC3718038.1 helix-turn-helix transcriptional regulator [Rouxiella badensis]MCC3727194.1 helix-turn-helix transcriptional regulator [Rouxiella badensis]MCC3731522.1 helix-turn-helix transcriptional regulator [Rouxiella badensis]MCC3738457.1 helix-turn-helix transcriptional regulator [Rouxiella badensis]